MAWCCSMEPTNIATLAPGETKTYGVKFLLADRFED